MKFNWQRNDYDALAGALAAGHIIECGAQCCGGNYAFFEEVPSFRDVGYPIAEIEANGNFTITKHPGTGGLVSVGTVKAQLLYEISTPAYYNPDVIAHFDTMNIEQAGEDRVYVSGCRGSTPPSTHKVCFNTRGPYKQSMETLLTGLDIEQKAERYLDAVFHNLGGREQFDDVDVQLIRSDHEDPESNEVAHAALRVTITHHDPSLFGRLFAAKVTELGLAGIPEIQAAAPRASTAVPPFTTGRLWSTVKRLQNACTLVVNRLRSYPLNALGLRTFTISKCPQTLRPHQPVRPNESHSGAFSAPAPVTKAATPMLGYGRSMTRRTAFCMSI